MFVQVHFLTSYSSVLLNRDDSGLAKRITFGGTQRTRVSSQSIKRKVRLSEGASAISQIAETSVRSRNTFKDLVGQPLVDEGFSVEAVVPVVAALRDVLFRSKAKAFKDALKAAVKNGDLMEALEQSAPTVLGYKEVEHIRELSREALSGSAPSDMEKAYDDARDSFEGQKKRLKEMSDTTPIDTAMFGRFVSGDPAANVDAAIHVAHAFSVHGQEGDIDLFTCVDDLDPDGASHMGETEINSPLLYGYAVIDVAELVGNLYGVDPKKWREVADPETAKECVRRFVHLMATDVVGAKKGSTAPYSTADFPMVEVGDDQPRTLANAFRKGVRADTDEAVSALLDYVRRKEAMYGSGADRWISTVADIETEVVPVDRAVDEAVEKLFA